MICPYCSQGNVAVEMFGFAVHKLSHRWIACSDRGSSPFYDGVIANPEDDYSRPFPPKRTARSPQQAQLTGTPSR